MTVPTAPHDARAAGAARLQPPAPRGDRRSVCFICPEYPPGPHGGVGSFTQVLGRALVRAGHEVRCIGIYPADYPAPDHEDDEGVRVWRLRERPGRGRWIADRHRLWRAVRDWARAGEVDVVEAPDSNGWFAGWPALPVPLVLRANGSFTYFAHELGTRCPPLLARLERWAYRRADGWAAVSRHTGEVSRRLFAAPAADAILYNPVELPDAPAPFAARVPTDVVFTGTLIPKKGVLALVDAWPAVRARVPGATLHLLGKDAPAPGGGGMVALLRRRLPAALQDSVVFHGHVGRAPLLARLRTARVAVFPSLTEAFGIAPVEAMACGAPTIYTRLTCGPEIVRDGVDGLLADPRDPADLAAAIVRLLLDEPLARRLGDAGRARARDVFAVEHGVVAAEAFYADALARFAARGRGR